MNQPRFDITDPRDVAYLVNLFYDRVRDDDLLGPIFDDVAHVDDVKNSAARIAATMEYKLLCLSQSTNPESTSAASNSAARRELKPQSWRRSVWAAVNGHACPAQDSTASDPARCEV